MYHFRILMILLMVALGFGLQACTTPPMSEYQVDEQRASVREMANETLEQLYQQSPGARRQIEQAAGYAVFSNFGLKVLFMGRATGEGIAVSHATQRETFMRMVKLQPGYGFGVQRFRLVFVFETPQAFESRQKPLNASLSTHRPPALHRYPIQGAENLAPLQLPMTNLVLR